jgi:hypothetical protein
VRFAIGVIAEDIQRRGKTEKRRQSTRQMNLTSLLLQNSLGKIGGGVFLFGTPLAYLTPNTLFFHTQSFFEKVTFKNNNQFNIIYYG